MRIRVPNTADTEKSEKERVIMNKKIAVIICVMATAGALFAAPHHGGGRHRHGGYRPNVHHRHHHHRPSHSSWGRGGRNFWPGFVGGIVGAAVARTVIDTTPTVITTPAVVTPAVVTPTVVSPTVVAPVVTTPVVTPQQVWVEGRYVDSVVNGTVVRVWQPGHYETQTITVTR